MRFVGEALWIGNAPINSEEVLTRDDPLFCLIFQLFPFRLPFLDAALLVSGGDKISCYGLLDLSEGDRPPFQVGNCVVC